MKNIYAILKKRIFSFSPSRPIFFNLAKTQDQSALAKLLQKNPGIYITDDYQEQLRELFAIKNPPLAFQSDFEKKFLEYQKNLTSKASLWQQGKWAYFPWLKTLVHILEERDFFTVRTGRNLNLITREEQKKFYNAKVGIAGLSIGNSVAVALVLQGGAKYIRLADFDQLALSNTNRIRAGVQNLGLSKVELTARQIYEINPYSHIQTFPGGITSSNIKKFIEGQDVIVDEMDNLSLKLLLRMEAKKHKIPVVMGADNGDTAVIDIERYDKKQKVNFFHSRLKNVTFKKLQNLNKLETGKTIAQLIGLENHTGRMLNSLKEIGKSVVSWPQLGGSAMLNGAAVAYCVRKVVCSQSLEDNRGIISLDAIFQQNYFSKKEKTSRQSVIKKFKQIFKL